MRALLVILLSSSIAEADSDKPFGQVSLGGVQGYEENVTGGFVEFIGGVIGASKPGDDLVGGFGFHASLTIGAIEPPPGIQLGSNRYLLPQLGLEARGCIAHGVVCVFGGADGAVQNYQKTLFAETDTPVGHKFNELMIVPRIGADIGVARFRFRLAAEVGIVVDRDDRSFSEDTRRFEDGFAFSLSVGYRVAGR